jgi:hypothetical protein
MYMFGYTRIIIYSIPSFHVNLVSFSDFGEMGNFNLLCQTTVVKLIGYLLFQITEFYILENILFC